MPVIIQRAKQSELPQTTKAKYLMPKCITIGKVQTILRNYLKDQDVSLYYFIQGSDNSTIFFNLEKRCIRYTTISKIFLQSQQKMAKKCTAFSDIDSTFSLRALFLFIGI